MIEKSIYKTYKKELYSPFVRAVKEFEMIKENDRVAVCISGGKDSFLLALLMKNFQKYSGTKFEVEYILMNPGYSKEDFDKTVTNAALLDIKINTFDTTIFDIVKDKDNPCYLCAKQRRGHLYAFAKSLNCNKIALGHHYDDVIGTIMLNLFYNGSYQSMMPKLRSKNFDNMELIRPLYFVRERDIIRWANYNNLNFIACGGCPLSKMQNKSMRLKVKEMLNDLEKENQFIIKNIFNSAQNVYLDSVIKHKRNGKVTHFLDEYS